MTHFLLKSPRTLLFTAPLTTPRTTAWLRVAARLTALSIILTAPVSAFAEPDTLKTAEGTTIIGTKEAPAVLNVVPWQGRELQADPSNIRPPEAQSVLEDGLKPIDREVLMREVEYFNFLKALP